MSKLSRRSAFLGATCLSLSFAGTALANGHDDGDESGVVGYERPAGIDLSGSLADAIAVPYAGEIALDALNAAEVEDLPGIVVRDGFDPNQFPPNGILDPVNINGIGQMIVWNGNGGVGTCTGSLVNPRMVIFAAHCVNTRPQEAYGAADGGTPIGFGFENYTIPGILAWLNSGFTTSEANAFYNVEHLWYDQRSVDVPEFNRFLGADVAIATLDTPAFDIPTWALLFTPLDGQEHVTVTGYGATGVGNQGSVVSGGFRRRAAENYVSFLGSFDDRNRFLFGSGGIRNNLYWTSFTDPSGVYNPGAGRFDFRLFGDGDTALPIEGQTGGGDSGGPLIVDRKYAIPVIAGVLSGGSRYFGAQPFGAYGSHSFYQPLHAYWDLIVANNPYVYATNKDGDGEWTDPGHWVQALDPNYVVDLDGELINGIPSVAGGGITGEGAKFGELCFNGNSCTPNEQAALVTAAGDPLLVEGGPGTEDFVPDNIRGIPGQQRPRYFDVTLSGEGTTRLSDAAITIDKLTVNGATRLDIAKSGSLASLGDFTQIVGWTNVDGTLEAREAFLLTGFLTGSGTLRAPFVSTAAVTVAPGGADAFGTLTIDGNMIMASGSALYIDASRDGADRLAVTGFLSLSDENDASSTGPTLVFNKFGRAPRHGQSFEIVSAAGGIEGTFGSIASFQGVLRPELTYGDTAITADLRAGKFVDIIGRNDATGRAFGRALDTLRDGSYEALYDFYGMVDLMDAASLSTYFASLVPDVGVGTGALQHRQSRMLISAVSDRLSVMGRSDGLAMVGAPETMRMGLDALTGHRNVRMGLADLAPGPGTGTSTGTGTAMHLPEGMSGFVSGGTFGARDVGAASFSQGGQAGSYLGMGLERRVSDKASFGVAIGYADGREADASAASDMRTTQVAAYGSYDLGGDAYVGGIASLETVDRNSERGAFDGRIGASLQGASSMRRYGVTGEVGVNLAVANGITLTPRASLAYDTLSLGGYDEQGNQAALAIDDLRMTSLTARGGFRLAGEHALGNGWNLTPHMRADYVRRVGGSDDGLTVRFDAADHVAIALPLSQGERSWGEVRGGVHVTNGTVSFGAGFETAVERSSLRDDRAVIEMGVRF